MSFLFYKQPDLYHEPHWLDTYGNTECIRIDEIPFWGKFKLFGQSLSIHIDDNIASFLLLIVQLYNFCIAYMYISKTI